ncbi:MAG: GNAT family N-acetyltransferase [Saprospiraceae bacterium]|nr:GNAT family N-acetyltransferase [Saprospiraceae bacterium]MCF8252697.1 GNAT family N-acetyltransferase [Saprospiraceae bacterium]MCF8282920.1 GNAT family N-acetyltransferase [Bacteroidales bacterium]MCF8311655.1 GNAT family N-acetyltransferase [Saprospiraceae bacterium]MCF8440996.1 GNAT family N-acetyltransferase [Saprospiraceae bacterium]
MNLTIEPLLETHYPAVRRIYEEGLATGIATFETQSIDWKAWDEKYLPTCRLVALLDGEVVGWAALTPYSKREVYRGVGEVAVYLGEKFRGRGIAKTLLGHLVEASEQAGFWTLQAVIFAKNYASIKLHESAGFRIVGVRERIAALGGVWHDNVLMERRS